MSGPTSTLLPWASCMASVTDCEIFCRHKVNVSFAVAAPQHCQQAVFWQLTVLMTCCSSYPCLEFDQEAGWLALARARHGSTHLRAGLHGSIENVAADRLLVARHHHSHKLIV